MNFDIRTTADLQKMMKYVEKHVKFALEDVAKVVEEEIKYYVKTNLYDDYEPSAYTRTYDYINSLTVKKANKIDNGYEVELFFDTDKIFPRPPDGLGRWSRHSSITSYNTGGSGDDVSHMIPHWLEYGVSGSLWDRDGIYSMENTKEIMEQTKYHLHEIVKALGKRGIMAVVL